MRSTHFPELAVTRCTAVVMGLLPVCLVCLAGCSGPVTVSPFGGTLQEEEIATLAGRWKGKEQDIQIVMVNDKIIVGALQFDAEHDEFIAINLQVAIRKIGKHNIGFVQTPDLKRYTVFLVDEYSSKKVTVRQADHDRFVSLVRKNSLGGEIIEAKHSPWLRPLVIIEPDPTAFEDILQSEKIEELFPIATRICFYRDRVPDGPGIRD